MNEGGVLRHCNHCSDSCRATKILSGNPPITHTNSAGTAKWDDFKCPACAERQLIVRSLHAEARRYLNSAHDCGSQSDSEFSYAYFEAARKVEG